MSDNGPVSVEVRTWPLGGYAPGGYYCICGQCRKQFEGDKRASECLDCAVRNAKALIESQASELKTLTTSGVIEVAIRNPSVAEYMRHWEGRAEKAEAALEMANKEIAFIVSGGAK
jgi:hypothetical protein